MAQKCSKKSSSIRGSPFDRSALRAGFASNLSRTAARDWLYFSSDESSIVFQSYLFNKLGFPCVTDLRSRTADALNISQLSVRKCEAEATYAAQPSRRQWRHSSKMVQVNPPLVSIPKTLLVCHVLGPNSRLIIAILSNASLTDEGEKYSREENIAAPSHSSCPLCTGESRQT